MSKLLDKIKAQSKITNTKEMPFSTFDNSAFNTTFNDNQVKTPLPILNIAYAGDLDGGVPENKLITIAGASKHYKSNLALLSVKGFMDKYEDGICIFFDSEFGISKEYMLVNGIDPSRVVHIPITNIEDLKFELVAQLEGLEKSDKVIFLIDSIGNLASKKEVEDALNEKSVADMTRAKQLKGLFRMVTPLLAIKNKTIIAINHVYDSQGLFSTKVVSGGTGIYYSSNIIFIITRSQEKSGTDVTGYTFNITIDKSRVVKEKEKVSFKVLFKDGIQKYSGLLDIALESGHVVKVSNGWYSKSTDDKKYREKDLDTNAEFWEDILNDNTFKQFVKDKYQYTSDSSLSSYSDDDFADEEHLND